MAIAFASVLLGSFLKAEDVRQNLPPSPTPYPTPRSYFYTPTTASDLDRERVFNPYVTATTTVGPTNTPQTEIWLARRVLCHDSAAYSVQKSCTPTPIPEGERHQ